MDFYEIADRLMLTVAEVSSAGGPVTATREGSFGSINGEVATPLAMVLTQVLQNAAEHGFGAGMGTVVVRAVRAAGRLTLTVTDDGKGLPEGFDLDASPGLGLSIVRTLVESELDGQLAVRACAGGGTRVVVDVPVR